MFRPCALAVAMLAAVLLALVGVHPSGPASADASQSVKTYKASARTGSLVAYRLSGVKAGGIRKARLSTRRRWQRIPLGRARRGARRGLLVVRASRKLLRPGAKRTNTDAAFTTPKLVIVQEDGSVSLADPIDTSGTTPTPSPSTPPAVEPVPDTPAPPAPGACAFGTFDVGNWPGACWRPYSNDSPFNQKLPENPRLVPNSSQIVQRITGFGPMENFTAGDSQSSDDYGDPVFWSQPSDPVYTVHCVEDWGTCEVEGDTIRIPDPAEAAGGTDGHMTVIDQASGWEYDFWAVKSKPRGGGTIEIGWGGKTRIDGLGLDSSATAAGFGNLAGKLRAEELAEGHIDHALFLAISCSNGKTVAPVDPAHGHAGRRCSEIGQSEVDAPPMGTRVQLDMTLAEIEALQLAPWKKTILRALREYGAIMGDTGSSWAIATESGSTYTSFGHEDKWVSYAKSAGVEYYAPESVYVFKMRNDIDWRSRLRVVDPCVSQRTC